MAAVKTLCLTSLFLIVSRISALQTGNDNKTACESSNVTIDFIFNIGNRSFADRLWYKNSVIPANRIARVDSAGSLTVESQYSGRIALSGLGGINLYNATKTDSGSYLFIILTDIYFEDGTATTTVNVYVNPNASCIPKIENNSADNFNCTISDACPGKDSIQAIWDDGSVGVFTCPSTTKNTKYKCCAKGDPVTYCYSGDLCTDIECIGSESSQCKLELGCGLGFGIGIPTVITIIVVVIFICKVSSVQTYVGSEVHFNFMLTEDSNESEVHIKNKSGGVVMIARGKVGRSGDPVYKGRLNFTGNTNQKLISFILRNVTLSDAGIYIAVHSDSNKIIGCQALIVKGKKPAQVPLQPIGNKPEQVPLQPIGTTSEDKSPEPDGTNDEDNPQETDGCKRPYILGLVLGLGLGITFIVGCIIIAILISTGTISCKLEFGLALGLCLGMSCVIAIIIAVIFICTGIPNRVKFGKGILTGLLYASVIGIFVVYLIGTNDEGNPQETDGTKNGKVPLTPAEVSSVQTYVGSEANFNFMLTEDSNESEVHIKNKSGGVVMIARGKVGRSDDPVYKDRVNFTGNTNQKLISFILRNVTLSDAGIYIAVHSDANRIIGCQALIVKDTKSKTNNSGSSSAVSREQVQVQMENKGVKDDDDERPPAVHTGTQNKVDPNTRSKQTNDRQQSVPPANIGFEDTPTSRPLPAPPQNGEIKDRNVRGISATIGDKPDLASETPRPIRLLPLTPKQATVQKEDASEEPKKKRKKKKKKDQMNVETPEEENGETDMRVN